MNSGTANSTGPDGEGWYNIRISDSQVDPSRGFADVQITCDLAEYTVSYSDGDQSAAENLPTDGQKYDVVNNNTIYIPSNIPTANDVVFQGWDVNEDGDVDYRPAAQVSLTDVLESANDNNQITFTAIWKSVQQSEYVTYTIHLYLEGQDEPVETYTGQGIDRTQLLVRSQEGSWIAQQLANYPDYELPENFTNTITLDKNGENTVKITLVKKTYTVTYDANDGTGTMDQDTVKSGENYTVKGNEFIRTGYEFTGWNTSQDGTGKDYSENATIVEVRENITLYAQWEQTTAEYTVKHWFEKVDSNEYEQNAAYGDRHFTGQIGQLTDAESYSVPGFTAKEIVQQTIAASGTVVDVYYDRNEHDVTYTYTDAKGDLQSFTQEDKTDVKFGATVTVATSTPEIPQGYEFSGWTSTDVSDQDTTFTMPDKNVAFTGSITPKTDTKYTVEWYFEDADGNYPAEADKTDETRTGTTADRVEVREEDKAEQKYENGTYVFDVDNEENVLDGTIAADGSTVLKLYFERKSYQVTYEYEGVTPVGVPGVPVDTNWYKWGTSVPVEDDVLLTGYTFDGWNYNGEEVADGGTIIMPDGGATLKGSWTIRTDLSYTINYYWVANKGVPGAQPIETTPRTGTFGETIKAADIAETFEGYTRLPDEEQTDQITISENPDNNVINVYYYKNVTLTANSDEKVYTGTEQTVEGFTVTDKDGMVNATFTGVSASGSGTDANTDQKPFYEVGFTGVTVDQTLDDTGCYIVTQAVPGKLIINPATMNLKVEGYDKVYDGAAHCGTVDGYPDGAELLYSTDGGENWSEKAPTVTDYTENPVTVKVKVTLANYTDATATYNLNVRKRDVILTSGSGSKTYDGTALTNEGLPEEEQTVKVGDDGFVEGEGVLDYNFTGSQTYVGKSNNTFEYEL